MAEVVDLEAQAIDKLYEVVNGEVVEQPPMGAYAHLLAHCLYDLLQPFVNRHQLGRAYVEMPFILQSEPRLERRPDVAFVLKQRLQGKRPRFRGAFDLVPNLAVEVLSPTNQCVDMDAKVLDYLDAGVQQVWVLHPETRRMYVHTSRSAVRVIGEQDLIEAADLLPGFSVRLGDVFAPVDEMS